MIDKKTLQTIKTHEGFKDKTYLDTMNIETIGYGRNLKQYPLTLDEKLLIAKNNGRYPREEAELWLISHCEILEKELNTFEWYRQLDEFRKGIILDMAYQLGIPRLLKFKLMTMDLRIKNFTGAATQMLKSAWAVQTPNRVKKLALMMEYGEEYQEELRNAQGFRNV